MSSYFRSQALNNSTIYHPTVQQGMSGCSHMDQRTNDGLSAPQNILTSAAHGQPSRVDATNQTSSSSSSNEQMLSSTAPKRKQQSP
jgi:hypothetical protein